MGKAICAKCINVIVDVKITDNPAFYMCKKHEIEKTCHPVTGIMDFHRRGSRNYQYDCCLDHNENGNCSDYFNPLSSTAE